jgi:2-polyprenyl-6-methoxyphenol hydroxylase-like FAD-dependent oxidoreductase
MKIAIVGTGNVGRALGSSLTKAGHDVTLTARDREKTRAVASEIGAAAAETPARRQPGPRTSSSWPYRSLPSTTLQQRSSGTSAARSSSTRRIR